MRIEDKNKICILWIAAMMIFAFSLAGCGSHSPKDITNFPIVNPSFIPPIINPDPIFPPDGDGEPLLKSFEVSGQTGTTPTYIVPADDIATDSILRIRIIAGAAQPIKHPSFNFTAEYGCVRYNLTVNGRTVQTRILAVPNTDNSNCAGATSSQSLDFSDRLGGPDAPVITVSHAAYDFYCKLYYQGFISGFELYCPVRPAYRTHFLSGTLSIQVNGTRAP